MFKIVFLHNRRFCFLQSKSHSKQKFCEGKFEEFLLVLILGSQFCRSEHSKICFSCRLIMSFNLFFSPWLQAWFLSTRYQWTFFRYKKIENENHSLRSLRWNFVGLRKSEKISKLQSIVVCNRSEFLFEVLKPNLFCFGGSLGSTFDDFVPWNLESPRLPTLVWILINLSVQTHISPQIHDSINPLKQPNS